MAFTFFISVSKKVQTYLTDNNISPRRDAGSGVWLTFLLPLAIVMGEFKNVDTSHTYKTAASISFGILMHTLITLLQANKNRFFPITNIILPCIISTLLLYYVASEGIVLSVILGITVILAYHTLIIPVMKLCPRNFTYGEATIALQSLLLFIVCCFVRNPIGANSCMDVSTVILQIGIICILGIGAASYHFNLKRKPKEFFGLFAVTLIAILLPPLHFLIGQSPLTWIFYLIIEDDTLMMLVCYWIVCCGLAAAAIYWQSTCVTRATTVTRKCFHVLIVLVFAPGIVLKPCFLYLASGVVFAILLTLDMVRILNIPVVGPALQTAFVKFSDEKDEGPLALTPIYLLVGCSLPLWIHPNPSQLLPLIAGVLSVGVGDTAASTCGYLVGKNKWPGSKKTKEGTAACFLSQLFLVIALIHFGYVPRTSLIKPFMAIAVASIAEAKTDQIDNIALPLLMYVLTV